MNQNWNSFVAARAGLGGGGWGGGGGVVKPIRPPWEGC